MSSLRLLLALSGSFSFFLKNQKKRIFVKVHGKLQLLPSCPNKKKIPSLEEKQFKRIQVNFNPQSNQTLAPRDLCNVALLLAETGSLRRSGSSVPGTCC